MAAFATGWTTVTTFSNGWGAIAGDPPQYRQDGQGVIWLRGGLSGGSSGEAAFTLPAGCRIGVGSYFPALQSAGAAGSYVEILTNGEVIPTYSSSGVYLSGIEYLAEN